MKAGINMESSMRANVKDAYSKKAGSMKADSIKASPTQAASLKADWVKADSMIFGSTKAGTGIGRAKIADRTILELVKSNTFDASNVSNAPNVPDSSKINNLNNLNSVNRENLRQMARLLGRVGADIYEIDAASLKFIDVFPPQSILLFHVPGTEERELTKSAKGRDEPESLEILRQYQFPMVALDIKEYVKPCWIDFCRHYSGEVMLEIEVGRISEAEKVLSIYLGYLRFKGASPSCLRLKGLEKQEPWLASGDTARLKRKFGLEICLSPVDTFATAGAICVEVMNGAADYITTSFCGKGEKGGWAALEEIILASYILYGATWSSETQVLREVSRIFSRVTREPIPPQKPVIGSGIFRCESGIHADGLYKNPSLYEPYPPELTGHQREIVIGKHSGIASLLHMFQELKIGGLERDQAREILAKVRAKSVELKRFLYPEEVRVIAGEFGYWTKNGSG